MRPLPYRALCRFAPVALVALLAPACRARPRVPPPAPSVVTPSAAATIAPPADVLALAADAPADAPAIPFSSFETDEDLLAEAGERASARVRAAGRAFRKRAIDLGYNRLALERVSLVDFDNEAEDVARDVTFERACDAHRVTIDEPARRALLGAFVGANYRLHEHIPEQEPSLEAQIDTALAARPDDATLGCVTPRSNALVELRIGEFETVLVRRAGAAYVDIAGSMFHRTLEPFNDVTPTSGDAYADLTGDGVNDAIRAFQAGDEDERRVVIEAYSADAPRAQRVGEFRVQVCAWGEHDTHLRHGCRVDALPSVVALYDQDRWILRVGLRTYRWGAQNRLVAAPPADPALAAWLATAQRYEMQLDALDAELSRVTPISLRRGGVSAQLRALGESAEDAARAEQRLVNLDAARETGRPLPPT